MVSSKVYIEKFTGKNDFNIWNIEMEALLITQGLRDVIELETKDGKRGFFIQDFRRSC